MDGMGNRLWQQDSRESGSRVTFSYIGSGALQGMLASVTVPAASPLSRGLTNAREVRKATKA